MHMSSFCFFFLSRTENKNLKHKHLPADNYSQTPTNSVSVLKSNTYIFFNVQKHLFKDKQKHFTHLILFLHHTFI